MATRPRQGQTGCVTATEKTAVRTATQNAGINLRLAQLGLPLPQGFEDTEAAHLAAPILARQRELSRRLADRLCAADGRIQAFLDDYLADTSEQPQLPRRTLVLDEPGLAAQAWLEIRHAVPRRGEQRRSHAAALTRRATTTAAAGSIR